MLFSAQQYNFMTDSSFGNEPRLFFNLRKIVHLTFNQLTSTIAYPIDLISFNPMIITLTDTIGFISAALTTVAFVPQVIRVWKTKSARDVSLGMYALFNTGVAMWLCYGLLIESWPVIAANSITLLLAGAVMVMKLNFDRN